MIDDIFAKRVFNNFDKIYKRLDETCGSIASIKTDVAVLKTNFDNHIAGKAEQKQDKKDKKVWYMGMLTFVVGTYIAVKELM